MVIVAIRKEVLMVKSTSLYFAQLIATRALEDERRARMKLARS